MPAESPADVKFEIGHVLFMDVVGYSKLLITEQSELIRELKQIVQETEQVRLAEAKGMLMRLPAGDGMALVFRNSAEAPVRCALEISQALKAHPELPLRMGIHSGPVNEVTDVNERINITGAGINMAQRVMDCGDAGHILLSKHVADDFEQYPHWRPHLHDLGECEVKHGARVHVVNLCTEELGNPETPEQLKQAAGARETAAISKPIQRPKAQRWAMMGTVLLIIAAIVSGLAIFLTKRFPTTAITTAAPAEKSIAVLPFENLSEEKANAYFADGVQDEILTYLARIADLKVISRTSVIGYRDAAARNLRKIGQELGVAHLLEGSVQRAGNRVRVNAQLVDTRTDTHLWAQTYDRNLSDVFAIQSEIAKTIAEQLQARLSPNEKNAIEQPPTSDITAFGLYARARKLIPTAFTSSSGKTNLLEAVDLLNQAVARDPSFVQAYSELAQAHDALYFLGFDHTPARLALAEAAIAAAFRISPDAGETHFARALNLYWGYLNYDGALAELEVAHQTLPNDSRIFAVRGFIQRRQGRWEESTRNLERSIGLDPRNVVTRQQVAGSYQALRRYADEKSALSGILAFEPDNAITKAYTASVDLDWKADTRPLHQMIDSIKAANPAAIPNIASNWLLCAMAERDGTAAKNALSAFGENPILFGGNENVPFTRPFVEGVIARIAKDEGKARSAFTAARALQEKIIQAQPNFGPAFCVLGLIDAGLGRKEEALREGRRAVELLPTEKDALDGQSMVKYLAMIAAWVGDKDLACEQLAIVIRNPSDLSYGQLKLLPFWDPLRGDPRFEKIVDEAKQPVALK